MRKILVFVTALACSVALDAASTRQITLFTVAVRDTGERFVVATDDPQLIARCRAQLSLPVADRQLFPIGSVVAGHGGFNTAWSWHVDPDSWQLTESSIELCDGRPSYLEAHLEDWLDEVGQYCPWGAYVATEGVPGPVPDLSRLGVELVPGMAGLDRPVAAVALGDGSGRLLVAEKAGRVRVVADGQLQAEAVLDISDRVGAGGNEQGLLGLAPHPQLARDARLFVDYTNRAGDTIVSSFELTTLAPLRADPTSEQVLLEVAQPFSNHNGGHLAFGPDARLYVGMGDGGSAGDPGDRAQDLGTLLGKMLRLDVDGPDLVPADNPFAGEPGARGEVWALGLRNPWRFSFDRDTGDLYIGDVGQSGWEEVDVEGARSPGGINWGWNRLEGFACYPSPGCDGEGMTPPAAVYSHDQGCSVTGGVVYRGRRFPFLDGTYLFADYCSGRIWALAPGGSTGWVVAEVGRSTASIVAFAEDEHGELWAVDLAGGSLLRLEARITPRPPLRVRGRID